MLINDSIIIENLQSDFTQRFPYLKLEFYKDEHAVGEGSSNKELLSNSLSIKDVRKKHNSGDLKILPQMTVNELETGFHGQFGLNVQVWRRSGNLWLQTITTDGWTLEQQNIRGKNSVSASESINPTK